MHTPRTVGRRERQVQSIMGYSLVNSHQSVFPASLEKLKDLPHRAFIPKAHYRCPDLILHSLSLPAWAHNPLNFQLLFDYYMI